MKIKYFFSSRKINFVVLIGFNLFVNSNVNAQPVSAHVGFGSTSNSVANAKFHIQLPDSTGITDVEVQLFDGLKDTLVFNRVFIFDQTTGLPAGLSWFRQGEQVQIGIGTVPVRLVWQGKVRLRNNAAQWSDWYSFMFD